MIQPISLSTNQLCKNYKTFRSKESADSSLGLNPPSNTYSGYEEEKIRLMKGGLVAFGAFGLAITIPLTLTAIKSLNTKSKKPVLKTFNEFRTLANDMKVPVLEKCKSLNENLHEILQIQSDLQKASPELIEKTGAKRINRLILNGKPGTGKSFFAKIYAKTIGADYLQINYADINSPWVGEGTEKMKAIFDYAEKMAKNEPNKDFVLVFNEIDAIIQPVESYSNGSKGTHWITKMEERATFLESVENLADQAPNVTIIGTTNLSPERKVLDGAALSRFQNLVEVSLPNKNQLYEALKMNLEHGSEYQEFARKNDSSLARLANTMEDKQFSFRDLDNIVETSKRLYFKDAMKNKDAKFSLEYLEKAVNNRKLTDGTIS